MRIQRQAVCKCSVYEDNAGTVDRRLWVVAEAENWHAVLCFERRHAVLVEVCNWCMQRLY